MSHMSSSLHRTKPVQVIKNTCSSMKELSLHGLLMLGSLQVCPVVHQTIHLSHHEAQQEILAAVLSLGQHDLPVFVQARQHYLEL